VYKYKRAVKLMKNTKYTSVSYTLSNHQKTMIELYAQLFLDEVCFNFNKQRILNLIDQAIESHDIEKFNEFSQTYKNLLDIHS